METSWFQAIPMSAKVWGLRILLCLSIVALCALASSGHPGLALIVTWAPNGLFVAAYLRGMLSLPQFLERVHPIEPAIYRRIGVGLAKRIVETRMWPLMCGNDLPPKMKTRKEFLEFTEQATRGAEICHAATFVLASLVMLIYLAAGNISAAAWILVFNILLNGYPVMLQRTHRWRIQQLRGRTRPERVGSAQASEHPESITAQPNTTPDRTRDK